MLKSLPNILTLMRLGLTVVFLSMLLYYPRVHNRTVYLDAAFLLFLIASLTDVVDGHVARRFNAISKFGRMVDPLVDKVLVCGAFICFAIIGEPRLFGLARGALSAIHWSIAAVLVAREAYVTVLRHVAEAKGIDFAATRSGKFKMVTQTFAIGVVLVKTAHFPTAAWASWFTSVTFAVMVCATVISGLLAMRRSSWQRLKAREGAADQSSKIKNQNCGIAAPPR